MSTYKDRLWFGKGPKEGQYNVYGFVERLYKNHTRGECRQLGQRYHIEVVSPDWFGATWWRKFFDYDCPRYEGISIVVDEPRQRGHAFFEVIRPSLEFPGCFELVPLEERLG